MNIVFSLRCSKMMRRRVSSSWMVTSCLFTEMRRSAVYSSTIWLLVSTCCCAPFVSSGRLMSMPFCVSGSAAMKMMSSTSSTSMSGVTFMSALAWSSLALTLSSAPKCL